MRKIFLCGVTTLLLGFIASSISTSAMADAASDYITLNCASSSCHGNPFGAGAVKFTVANLNTDFPTNAALANFIAANMPLGNVGACTGACSQAMAAYLRPVSNPNNQPPVADMSSTSPTVGVVPLAVEFWGCSSTDDQSIVSYAINFGDGTSTTSSTCIIDHTYTAAGTYTATLTVADSGSLTNSVSLSILAEKVHNPPKPNASKSSNLSGIAPLTPTFDASLSTCDGGCKRFDWYVDGVTSPQFSGVTGSSYTLKDVGTHAVKLTVTDGGNDSASTASINLTVTVTASSRAPTANATRSSNLIGAAPLTAKFDGSLSNCDDNCSSYAWNFGDGTSATLSDATPTTHTYSNPGTYTATLTVTDKSNGKKASATVQVKVVPAESLATYVQACQSQLNFTGTPIPNLDCYDSDLFVKSDDPLLDAINDRVGYKKITDQVDVAFACRWLFGDKANRANPISIEMLVHNRSSGNTCYFSAKGPLSGATNRPDSHILSPNDTNAATFWDPPATVDGNVRCINCHISGPYISTPLIAPFLAKYGLLNNGHDTLSNVIQSDLATPNRNVKYHAISGTVNNVPGAFSQWDSLKQSYIDPSYLNPSTTSPGCSLGCHSVGALSPQQADITQPFGLGGGETVLTSPLNQLKKIADAGAMPPYQDWSDYRWINLSIPDAGTESETFANARGATTTLVPKLLTSCVDPAKPSNLGVPNVMEAHVVGSDNEFVIAQPSRFAFLPDRLATFNLKDGLTCLNSDQDAGQPKCSDYSVQYECTTINATTNSRTWVNWPKHSLSGDGDHEERNGANPCPSGSTATGIQASVTLSNGWTYSSVGPNDRLAAFSQYGLTCNNSDQPDNKCSNYVVRFSSCGTAPATQPSKTLTNENTFLGAKQLTSAANSLVKAQGHNGGWNTQAWTIEPIVNTEYVRIRIPNQNIYLNVSSTADPTAVSTATLNTGWTSEMWLIEPVANSSYVRLKNLWTGKYLTMADPTTITDPTLKDYIPIYSQGRNTGWNTQRWLIQ